MANEENSIPEWGIFKRLENLEKMSATKPTLYDTFVIANIALTLAFTNATATQPHRARKLKDVAMGTAKRAGVSKEGLEILESLLLMLCKEAEQ